MSNARRAKYGFTLIEALVSIVILSIGVVGAMEGYKNLARTESRAQTSEYLQRLAFEKYDEMIGTAPTQLVATNGDFSDRNITGYSWALTVDTTSVTDLMSVTVTVTPDNSGSTTTGPRGVAHGLYYQTQTTTGGTQ